MTLTFRWWKSSFLPASLPSLTCVGFSFVAYFSAFPFTIHSYTSCWILASFVLLSIFSFVQAISRPPIYLIHCFTLFSVSLFCIIDKFNPAKIFTFLIYILDSFQNPVCVQKFTCSYSWLPFKIQIWKQIKCISRRI